MCRSKLVLESILDLSVVVFRFEKSSFSPSSSLPFTFHHSLSFSPACSSLLGAHVSVDESIETIRQFRVEQTYAVKAGKWYFEFEALSGGDMRVGWARPACRPDVELGADDQAYVFDGYRVISIQDLSLIAAGFCSANV